MSRFKISYPTFIVFSGLFVCAFSVCVSSNLDAQPGIKPPAFDKKQLDAADALIKDVFKDEFASAKTNKEAGRKLAEALLDQSKRIFDEAEVRYVALTLARDLAADAGDQPSAFAVIDELAKFHQVDAAQMKGDVLAKVIDGTADAGAAKGLAELGLKMANELATEDQFDLAVRYVQLAETAAKKSKDLPLINKIAGRSADLLTAQKETAQIQPLLQKLKANPLDPAANLEVGKSWCFARDKWEKGLPYLAKGGHPVLEDIAKKDLAAPFQAKAQADLGQAWWDVAQKNQGQTKMQMLRRSYQWYMRAVFQLEGVAKDQVQAKLKELTQILPPKLRVTDIETEVKKLIGHTGEVQTVALSPNGMQAISGGTDKIVRLWDLSNGQTTQTFTGHTGTVFCVAFAPDGKHIFSSGDDATLRQWEMAGGKEVKQFAGQSKSLYGLAVSPNGKLVAGAGEDSLIYVWEVDSGKKIHELAGHGGPVWRIVFSPDNQQLASVGDDKTARLWEVKTGKQLKEFTGHAGPVLALALSPDGGKLLTGSQDNTARLWDIATGKEIQRFAEHTNIVGAVAFSPDGSRVITGSDDRTLRLWEADTGQLIRKLEGHTDAVFGVAFAPDGRWVLSCSLDKTLRLWGERK